MLAKKHRLTGRDLLEEVKSKGTLYQSNSFGVIVLKQKEMGPSRFAFIVSTKISKRAVDRNRITRRLRKAARENLEKILKGNDVLFLAKRKIMDRSGLEITKEAELLFKEAGLIE